MERKYFDSDKRYDEVCNVECLFMHSVTWERGILDAMNSNSYFDFIFTAELPWSVSQFMSIVWKANIYRLTLEDVGTEM